MKKSEDKLDASMRILKTSTCNTLSSKSKLTYHIGVSPDSVIHLRVFGNSSSGAFSREWVSLNDVQTALKKRLDGQAITSYLLDPLFKGKSVNTPAFLLAVLAQEKLVRPIRGKKREHEIMGASGFIAKVEKLIASNVDVKIKETVTKTTAKTPIKKTTAKTAGNTVRKTARKTPVTKSTGATTKKTATKKAAIKKRSTARQKNSTSD